MGCNCAFSSKEKENEFMTPEEQLPPTLNEDEKEKDKEKEKENENESTSVHSVINSNNRKEEKIIDKEKEKPKLLQKVSLKGNFLENSISNIIEEINPEANKIELPEFISKEHSNTIELPPIKLDNGNIYGGEWNLKGQREGYGINIDKNNNIYKGLWKNNNYGEYGCLFKNNGSYYQGQLCNGVAKGKGELTIIDKLKYIGDFDNNLPNGEGNLINYEDDTNYNGHIINGIKEGLGTLEFSDGTKYEGEFKQDKFNGKGKIIYPNGEEYEGEFKNNLKEGKGIYKCPDGNIYEGEYKNNAKNGKGKLFLEENKFYEGNWINDQPHGKGICNVNGEKFPGIFRYGKMIINDNKN